MIKKSESLKKKGGRAGKTKATWGWMRQTPFRKLIIDLPNGENDGIISKRNTTVGNRIKMANSMIKKD